jgi:hypothetical protein
MSNKAAVLWLAIGIVIGGTATAGLQIKGASAQGVSALWQLGVDSGGQGAGVAWRLNSATGHMETCSASGGTPRCFTMPAPSN